jgi:tetratricopeptide (TPR) repeat protein
LELYFYFCRLILLNKLLEDGNTLFRKGRLPDAAYRYEYALRRLPRLRPPAASISSSEDIFAQLKTHLLLNLSRTKRKLGQFSEAEDCAGQVLASRPGCHEAWWARAKAKTDQNQLKEALADLREALKLAPQNLQLHAFSLQVKNQLEAMTIKTKNEVTDAKATAKNEAAMMTASEDENEISVIAKV